jgi:hypothetical protein
MYRRFVLPEKENPGKLFSEALRNENNGYFEIAIINYEKALKEVKGNGLLKSNLRSKIIAKIKILYTVIDYKNGFHLGR